MFTRRKTCDYFRRDRTTEPPSIHEKIFSSQKWYITIVSRVAARASTLVTHKYRTKKKGTTGNRKHTATKREKEIRAYSAAAALARASSPANHHPSPTPFSLFHSRPVWPYISPFLFQLARFIEAIAAIECVLVRRRGTADDYVLRAKIRWAAGMVRDRTQTEVMVYLGCEPRELVVNIFPIFNFPIFQFCLPTIFPLSKFITRAI